LACRPREWVTRIKAETADLADQFGKLWATAADNGFSCGQTTKEIFLLAVANAICVIRSFRFYPRDPAFL
jgi:hypothetical protein